MTTSAGSVAPDLIVCTRFGLRVRNREWLEHRLELMSAITAPSLLAQSDQNFHWVVLIDHGLPADIHERLEELLQPFAGRGWLRQRELHSSESIVQLAEDRFLSAKDNYLLTGRIDDDDAWSTIMVETVRKRAATWLATDTRAPGIGFTFQDGLEWIMYEMLDINRLLDKQERFVHRPAVREYSLPFIATSVFVCSELAVRGTAIGGAHSRVVEALNANKGFEVDVIESELPMWLCCRHKQAGSGIRKAQGAEVPLEPARLAAQFGLDEAKVRAYLDHADDYRYTLVKSPLGKKHKVLREWLQATKKLESLSTDGGREREELERQREKLVKEMKRLEEHVLGDPDEYPIPSRL